MDALLHSIFASRIERSSFEWLKKIFSIHEIEGNKVLQWVFGASAFSYFLAFNSWIDSVETTQDVVSANSVRCWPYFQSCGDWLVMHALPEGYSQTFLYMVLFALLVLCVYLIWRKEWTLAWLALLPAFLWHALGTFLLTDALAGNYDYYIFILTFVLLFLPHKEFFLKTVFVLFYTLSTVAKIHETWILGTYFSSLKTGLPLFPDWSIPIWTNVVIGMEMIGAWFLMSRRPYAQRLALIFFVTFHLYSGLLVEYRYPATVLPTLLILFGPMYRYTPVAWDFRSIAGWTLVLLMCVLQFVPRLIPGDEKLTMEGNRFGLYMFEANHQCVSVAHIYKGNGEVREDRRESASARARCDPYRYWFRVKQTCQRHDVDHIAWTFDHSVNGGPFLRIVDVEDACALSYRPLGRNLWIKTELDNPAIVGWPVENIYR